MTPEEVRAFSDAMMDERVAVKVMGWRRSVFIAPDPIHDKAYYVKYLHPVTNRRIVDPFFEGVGPPPSLRFTTDGNAMLAVIEKMKERGYSMIIIPGQSVALFRQGVAVSESENPNVVRAVAEASVLAVMKEERA